MNFCENCGRVITICEMCGRQLRLNDEIICFNHRHHFCGRDCLNDFGSFHDENVIIYDESSVIKENEV